MHIQHDAVFGGKTHQSFVKHTFFRLKLELLCYISFIDIHRSGGKGVIGGGEPALALIYSDSDQPIPKMLLAIEILFAFVEADKRVLSNVVRVGGVFAVVKGYSENAVLVLPRRLLKNFRVHVDHLSPAMGLYLRLQYVYPEKSLLVSDNEKIFSALDSAVFICHNYHIQ